MPMIGRRFSPGMKRAAWGAMQSGDFPKPVAFWKFGENTGLTAKDSSPNGNDGTLSVPTWVKGYLGPGLSFDGLDDYVRCGSNPILGAAPFTLSAWIKVLGYKNAYTGIIAIGMTEVSRMAYIGQITSNNLGGGFYGVNYDTGVLPALGVWYHLLATFSGGAGGTHKIYVNSVLKTENTVTPNLLSDIMIIGMIDSTPPLTALPFKGVIDEVRIYDVALTARQGRELILGME